VARRGRTREGIGGTLILDADGVNKIAAADPRAQAALAAARRRDARVVVSAVTLAETLRGGQRDVPVHRVLDRVTQLSVSPAIGRNAGELLGSTALVGATVDAIVAATALDLPGPVLVLTSDPGDLRALTQARDDVAVERV